MELNDFSVQTVLSILGGFGLFTWWFYENIIKKDMKNYKTQADNEFKRVDDEIEQLKSKITEIDAKFIDHRLALTEITTSSKYMHDAIIDMKKDLGDEIKDLYNKMEALIKK